MDSHKGWMHLGWKSVVAVTLVLCTFAFISIEVFMPGAVSVGDKHSVFSTEIQIMPQHKPDPEASKLTDENLEEAKHVMADIKKSTEKHQ